MPPYDSLAEVIAANLGLVITPDRRDRLPGVVAGVAEELGFRGADECLHALTSRPLRRREVQALAARLTVGESHFFRSPQAFAALEHRILPDLLERGRERGRRLRIWSAGCSVGQEPYSLAILLCKMLPDVHEWDIRLHATDISLRSLKSAEEGVYTKWSFRTTPEWVVSGYFTRWPDGRRQVVPEVRKMVRFRYLNLAEAAYPSEAIDLTDMDLILCRNVLIYFGAELGRKVADRLSATLSPGGYLMVAPSEASRELFPALDCLHEPGEILFRRPAGGRTRSIMLPDGDGRSLVPPAVTPAVSDLTGSGRSNGPGPQSPAPAVPTEPVSHPRPPIPGPAKSKEGHPSVEGNRSAAATVAEQARTLADEGRAGEALALVDEAIGRDKVDPSLHYLRATVLQELGRSEDAEAALRGTLFLDQRYAPARVLLGVIAEAAGRTGEAQRHFSTALDHLRGMPADRVIQDTDGLTAADLAGWLAGLLHEQGAAGDIYEVREAW